MSKILIVGGTKGIGAALVEQLYAQHSCIVFSRHAPEQALPGVEYHTVDVLQDPLPAIEGLRSLVYCPGSINLKPIRSLKESDFKADFDINVVGAVRAVKQYFSAMSKMDGASMLFFSTVAVGMGMPFHSSVAAAKGAVEGFTRSLAAELAPSIRVNCIAPTITDTPLAAGILRNDKMREKLAEQQPLKRIGTAKDVAALGAFLIGDGARLITGQVLQADAGLGSIKP